MKNTKASTILIICCLGIAVFTIYWSFIVLFEMPRGGLGWSYKRDLSFVKQNFVICLVSPDKNITSDDLSYINWASKEFQARAITGISILLLLAGSAIIIKFKNKKKAITVIP